MATAVFKIKKLYNNFASLSTATIDLCVNKGCNLKVVHDGKGMTIPLAKLEDPEKFQIKKRLFRSRVDANKVYELYDFPFSPDGYVDIVGGVREQDQVDSLYLSVQKKFDDAMVGFVPQFGNDNHIFLLSRLKKIKESLKKLKEYKAGMSRAQTLAKEIESSISNIEFLKNKRI